MRMIWDDKKVIREIKGVCDKKLKEVAEAVERDAKAKCPVDTGAARDSIQVFKSKYKDGGYFIIGGAHSGRQEWYFTLLELGSVKYAPKAMLRRALRKNIRKFKREFGI